MTDTPKPFVFDETGEAKRYAPATERNRDVIIDILRPLLPEKGNVLEVASGTGEHIVRFAQAFPGLAWQPSDYDKAGLASIVAWTAEAGLSNIVPPVHLDASASEWPIKRADAIICINMVHIAPWAATKGLFAGAARLLLGKGALLYFYGPYREAGVMTAQSNQAFDTALQSRDPEWGLRTLEDMVALADLHGFILDQRLAMPANNLSLVFRKTVG